MSNSPAVSVPSAAPAKSKQPAEPFLMSDLHETGVSSAYVSIPLISEEGAPSGSGPAVPRACTHSCRSYELREVICFEKDVQVDIKDSEATRIKEG